MVIVSGLLILNHFMNKTITGNTLPDSLISIFPAWAFCQMCFSSIAIAGQFSPGLNLTQVYKTRQATQRNHRRLAADVLHRMDNAVLPPPELQQNQKPRCCNIFSFTNWLFFWLLHADPSPISPMCVWPVPLMAKMTCLSQPNSCRLWICEWNRH